MIMPMRLKIFSVLSSMYKPPKAPIIANGNENSTMNGERNES